MLAQLRRPLDHDVVEGGDVVDGVAEEEHVRAGVHERPETLELLLAGGVPHVQVQLAAVQGEVDEGVVEDGRPVLVVVREAALLVGVAETRLAHGAVADDDQLDVLPVGGLVSAFGHGGGCQPVPKAEIDGRFGRPSESM